MGGCQETAMGRKYDLCFRGCAVYLFHLIRICPAVYVNNEGRKNLETGTACFYGLEQNKRGGSVLIGMDKARAFGLKVFGPHQGNDFRCPCGGKNEIIPSFGFQEVLQVKP